MREPEPAVTVEPAPMNFARVVVPLWKGALAFDGFEGEGIYERDGLFEIPAFFLGGQDPGLFQAVSVQGMSMSPRIQSGEKVIIRTGSDLISGAIVLLQNPDGKAFLKVLELSPRPRAVSLHEAGIAFDDLTGWVIIGHAIGIYGDPEKGTRNIEYADGRVLRV